MCLCPRIRTFQGVLLDFLSYDCPRIRTFYVCAGFFSCVYNHELGHFQGMCWIFLAWLYPIIRKDFGGGREVVVVGGGGVGCWD